MSNIFWFVLFLGLTIVGLILTVYLYAKGLGWEFNAFTTIMTLGVTILTREDVE